MRVRTWDVAVVGAGPAGSTVANLLATSGHRVVVLEKAEFPRFHVGESLLPVDAPILERLGYSAVRTQVLPKEGATFLEESTGAERTWYFRDGLPGTPVAAWQVERARFDDDLAALAQARGAEVRFGTRVVEVRFSDEGVRLTTRREAPKGGASQETGTVQARFVVDASGQSAWLARAHRSLAPIRGFGLRADFARFDGLGDAARDAVETEGNILIFLRDDGWSWGIPLGQGRLSVGFVTRERGGESPEVAFHQGLQGSPRLRALTEGARRSEVRRVGNYSFANVAPGGARFGCVGDASAFLDPVFSSGVSLAMLGAERLADVLDPALRASREAEPDLLRAHHERMKAGYVAVGSLVRAFYESEFARHFFLHPDPDLDLRAGLISMLAGDVWRDDNRFQRMLVASRRRRFSLPEERQAAAGAI